MQHVVSDAVSPTAAHDAEKRPLSDALGTTDLALCQFSLAPGEWASGLHAHLDQEEVYVVLAGDLTVETLDSEQVVAAGEAVRFAPGEYHGARSDGDDETVFLALGAPKVSEQVRIPLTCPDCDHEGLAPTMGDDGPRLACTDCGAEVDAACPDCGSADVQATVPDGASNPAGACQACGVESRP